MKNCLATTGISATWDFDSHLVFLGHWCTSGNEELLENIAYEILPSPWKPALKIKESEDFCERIYTEVFPALSDYLNSLHNLSYPQKYWQVLIGPWLINFISVIYDRYNRIEDAFTRIPNLYTYVLPERLCDLSSLDTFDSLSFEWKIS